MGLLGNMGPPGACIDEPGPGGNEGPPPNGPGGPAGVYVDDPALNWGKLTGGVPAEAEWVC